MGLCPSVKCLPVHMICTGCAQEFVCFVNMSMRITLNGPHTCSLITSRRNAHAEVCARPAFKLAACSGKSDMTGVSMPMGMHICTLSTTRP